MRGGCPTRSARRRPTCLPLPRRSRQASTGASRRSASAPASSPAGSKPRRRSRGGAGGTGTITPLSMCAGASHSIRSAIRSATGSRRRNFSAATSSRATSSWGADDQARSNPAGPFPSSGSAAASRRPHRVHTIASARHDFPQAAQLGGTKATATALAISIPPPCPATTHTWRAKSKSSREPLCQISDFMQLLVYQGGFGGGGRCPSGGMFGEMQSVSWRGEAAQHVLPEAKRRGGQFRRRGTGTLPHAWSLASAPRSENGADQDRTSGDLGAGEGDHFF